MKTAKLCRQTIRKHFAIRDNGNVLTDDSIVLVSRKDLSGRVLC